MRYEVRFSAQATRRYVRAGANKRRIRHRLHLLSARAGIDPRRLTDLTLIRCVRDRERGFYVISAGHDLVAFDVLPEKRAVLVLLIVGRHELAARLGVRYSLVNTVFSSR